MTKTKKSVLLFVLSVMVLACMAVCTVFAVNNNNAEALLGATGQNNIYGYIDEGNFGYDGYASVRGWGVDMDNPAESVRIEMWIIDAGQTPYKLTEFRTNTERPDVKEVMHLSEGKQGFEYDVGFPSGTHRAEFRIYKLDDSKYELAEQGQPQGNVKYRDYTATKATVEYKNYDGTLLQTAQVEYDEDSPYVGEIPTKPSTATSSFIFNGWEETKNLAGKTILYTAKFAEVKISKISISLQNNIKVNYKVDKNLAAACNLISIDFTFNGVKTTVSGYNVIGDYAVFSFVNVGMQQMGDEITAELKCTINGITNTATKVYSVKQYCYDLLATYPTDALTRTLAVDTLNVGAAAQKFYGYKTSALINADLTPEQQAWATPERAYESVIGYTAVVECARATFSALQLFAENNAAIDLQFALAVGDFQVGDYIEIVMPSKSGTNVWQVEVSDLTPVQIKVGDKLVDGVAGHFKGLDATVLSEKMYLTVYDGEGNAISNTLQYSIETYCANKCDSKETVAPNLAQFVKAVMSYGDGAKAYAQGK